MKLSIIDSGYFKLDGGAMFGIVPKSMWSKLNPPDEKNLCTWALRCLLIESGDKKILVDTGLGNKQSEKFFGHFEPHGSDSISSSLNNVLLNPDDITDVLITHLHFDHVGGALYMNESEDIVPVFRNAQYWSNKQHFDWAYNPNDREKASFLKENFVPLEELGILNYVPTEDSFEIFDNINVKFVFGHTEAMMIPYINLSNGNVLVYCADLMPSSYHIRKPYIMGYDIRPLITLEEREWLYEIGLKENVYLFFEHDPVHPVGKLKLDDRGRMMVDTNYTLDQIQSPIE